MKREREKSIYPLLYEISHKIIGMVYGKNNDAGVREPRFDIRNNFLDVVGRKTDIRCNHQVKLDAGEPLRVFGETPVGVYNCRTAAMFSKYQRDTGPKCLRLRYDQNVLD